MEDRTLLAVISFINPNGGSWNTPSNWSGGKVPGASDTAVIDLPGGTDRVVTHTSTSQDRILGLVLKNTLALSAGGLKLYAPSTIDGQLTVSGGTLQVTATTLDGTGSLVGSGGGTVLVWGASAINVPLTNGAGTTLRVQGNSSIGPSTLTVAQGFTNSGTIDLTDTGAPLAATLAVTTGTLTNLGTITATAGLRGPRYLNALLDSSAGVLNFGSNGTLFLSGARTVLGTRTTLAGKGQLVPLGTHTLGISGDWTLPNNPVQIVLDSGDVTIEGPGRLTLARGRTLTLSGDLITAPLTVNGVLATAGPVASTLTGALVGTTGMIDVAGGDLTASLAGGGTFTNDGTLRVAAGRTLAVQGGSLSNLSAGTLLGGTYLLSGTLQMPGAAITSDRAKLLLDGPGSRIIDQDGNDALANLAIVDTDGTFTIQNGRTFVTTSDFTCVGTAKTYSVVIGAGSTFISQSYTNRGHYTTLQGGTLAPVNPEIDFVVGVLSGFGTVVGNLTLRLGTVLDVRGDINIPLSTGLMTITGNLTQQIGGAVRLDIAGTDPSQYDQLVVQGTLQTGGPLLTKLLNGFVPALGDTFLVVICPAISAPYRSFQAPVLSDGKVFRQVLDGTGLKLVVELA